MALAIVSNTLADGRPIPHVHAVATPTEDGRAEIAGANRSPHLSWSGEPTGTRSFALSVVDPDVPADRTRMAVEELSLGDDEPRVDFAHWLLVDIPPDVHEIAEGAGGDGFVPHGRTPGRTSFGAAEGENGYRILFEGNGELEGTYGGWDGPFPPWNDEVVHRYAVTVHALDVESLGLDPGFDLQAFRTAIEGHVLEHATMVPTYTLNPRLREGGA